MKPIQCFLGALGILFIAVSPAHSESFPSDEYQESALAREQIVTTWLTGEIEPVRLMDGAEYTDRDGSVFTVSNMLDSGSDMLAISVEPTDPVGIQGSWILYRRLSDGQGDHIRIYPVKDASVYITLRPDSESLAKGKTLLDLTVYGAPACRSIPLGISFERAYTAPLSAIVALSERTVPWELLKPEPELFRDTISAVSAVREGLASLVRLEDGAFDDNGQPVMIGSGRPQNPDDVWAAIAKGQDPDGITGGVDEYGFAKWIVDGAIRTRTGSGLFINPLKTPTDSPSGLLEDPSGDNRDQFMALDWSRNLASAAVTVSAKKTLKPDVSGVDVTLNAFTATRGYIKNVGYRVQDLLPLLYYLAIHESGHFYLGALNEDRTRPGYREYRRLAVIFPYFDENGQFTVSIFENVAEMPTNDFIRDNTGSFINLVRVRIPEDGYFQP